MGNAGDPLNTKLNSNTHCVKPIQDGSSLIFAKISGQNSTFVIWSNQMLFQKYSSNKI